MTTILAVDPGLNTGAALGYYDAATPLQILERWQIHDGPNGFDRWMERGWMAPDEIVVEKFIGNPEEHGDIVGVPIEGMLLLQARYDRSTILWHDRTDKGLLVGYPAGAETKAQRQRCRFDFLDRHQLFKPGTENDDSNDAVTHLLVSLKRRKHMPTMRAYWGPGRGGA